MTIVSIVFEFKTLAIYKLVVLCCVVLESTGSIMASGKGVLKGVKLDNVLSINVSPDNNIGTKMEDPFL